MNYTGVIKELKSLGTAQNVKVYKRHGVGDNLYGVSFANLGKLKKVIKTDHELALQLWKSGNVDARFLATMVADPNKMTPNLLENWIRDVNSYVLVDVFVGNLASHTSFAKKKAEEWTQSKEEWRGRAGWVLMAHLAMKDESLSDPYFDRCLKRIEKNIHKGKNRVKDAMNSSLIAIGIRNASLQKKALAVAKKIGKVEVDHGETNCKTPDAASYIAKAWARKKKSDTIGKR